MPPWNAGSAGWIRSTRTLLSRTRPAQNKTICLAITPSLKSYGISGRGRLFEYVSALSRSMPSGSAVRQAYIPARLTLCCGTAENPSLAMDFIIAPPHMAHYMAYSSRIYAIYMKYVAPEDMVVYSIECSWM